MGRLKRITAGPTIGVGHSVRDLETTSDDVNQRMSQAHGDLVDGRQAGPRLGELTAVVLVEDRVRPLEKANSVHVRPVGHG